MASATQREFNIAQARLSRAYPLTTWALAVVRVAGVYALTLLVLDVVWLSHDHPWDTPLLRLVGIGVFALGWGTRTWTLERRPIAGRSDSAVAAG